jgi:hypothetical protein
VAWVTRKYVFVDVFVEVVISCIYVYCICGSFNYLFLELFLDVLFLEVAGDCRSLCHERIEESDHAPATY